MRLITWNVAGRVTAQPAQARAILGAGADVVCLQEVTIRTAPAAGSEALSAAGYTSPETALDGLPPKPPSAGSPCHCRPRARGALARARRALGRARAVLRRRRDRSGQRPLPHRPVARVGQDPHPRGGRGLSARTLGAPARVVRGPEHPAPGARGRNAAHLRPRHQRTAAARTRPNGGTWPSGRWCATSGGWTRGVHCTDTAAATRVGRSRMTAAAGGSTTCYSTDSHRPLRLTVTTGAARV